MTGDRVIRFTTAAVVCAVAAFAAVVTYSHIYGLGRAHGQDGTAARLLPLSVDGLILAASLVLLHEARNGRDAPGLARFMLWLGIGATIGANIAYGAGYGLLGALISAWPAVAFIGAVEIAMQQVRRARGPRAATSGPAVPAVPGDVEQAVRAAYAASVAAGQPLSQRAMAERFGLSRRRVSQLVTQVTVEATAILPRARQHEHEAVRRAAVVVPALWPWFGHRGTRDRGPGCLLHRARREVALQIAELTDELAGETQPGRGLPGQSGPADRRPHQAEELICHEYGPPEAEGSRRRRGRRAAPAGGTADGRGPQPPVVGGGERRAARARKRP